MTTANFASGAYSAARNLLQSSGPKAPIGDVGAAGKSGGFGDMLQSALDGLQDSGRKAETQAMSAANGKSDMIDVVTAVAETETALQTLVAVRDRVISAYEEIMRMQI